MIINKIFKEYRENKNKKEISISQIKKELGNMLDKIVLYGAGSAGIAFLHYLRDAGIYPRYFSDGNPKRWGTILEDIPVINYKQIVKEVGEYALVIITINTDGKKYCKSFDEALRIGGHSGVYKNLYESGCNNIIDYTYFRDCWGLFQGDRYNLPSCSDVYLMEKHENNLCQVYDILADHKSKEVFEKIVRFRMLDDSIEIPTENQDKQYFEYNFFPQKEDEIFVDCGAFNGISLKMFLQVNNYQFKKYYAVEPDLNNYKVLENYIMSLPGPIKDKIEYMNVAAYNRNGIDMLYSLEGPGSFIADIGRQEVRTVKIDDIVDDQGATFIKMNIEGSELQALRGAQQTIRKFKPRLAIAGYHKTGDLWDVPSLILSLNPSYNVFLRSYMNHISFVYYAV